MLIIIFYLNIDLNKIYNTEVSELNLSASYTILVLVQREQ